MAFKIGQKVVCISGSWEIRENHLYNLLERNPKEGEQYTIRDIVDGAYLRFEEIRNPILKYRRGYTEVSYSQKSFIPIEETFHRMTFKEVVEAVVSCENWLK